MIYLHTLVFVVSQRFAQLLRVTLKSFRMSQTEKQRRLKK